MLWNLPAIQETFKRRHMYIPNHMDYFFQRVTTIMSVDYKPTTEDLLKSRIRTTGMSEYKCELIDGHMFTLYDVGGNRKNRRKWIHQFADVDVVFFCVALDEYNTFSFENEEKNALHESIEFFAEICNSKWLRKSDIILFLTKDNLFKEKLRAGITLSECFAYYWDGWQGVEWSGEFDYHPRFKGVKFDECHRAAINFIQNAFKEVGKNGTYRIIQTHVVSEGDQLIRERISDDLQHIIVQRAVRKYLESQSH